MRFRAILISLALLVLPVIGWAAQQTIVIQPGDTLDASCSTTLTGTIADHSAHLACAAPTPVPGWHAPTTHEHGDQPPAWVLADTHPSFTQNRESHEGYKGFNDDNDQGDKHVSSYIITHILSSPAARSHGDHDYQLWVRNPGSGAVAYIAGQLDFGSPPPLRTSDSGERPIILAADEQNACEIWYSRPGSTLMDVGQTICNKMTKFGGGPADRGTRLGNNRSIDWSIPCARLGQHGASWTALDPYCTVAFGTRLLQWRAGGTWQGPELRQPN